MDGMREKGDKIKGEKESGDTAVIDILIIGIIAVAIILGWVAIHFASKEIMGIWIVIVGLLSFFIPLVLSFSKRLNLGTRLSKGEVRKSIVISFTVVYIILLVQSFVKTAALATNNATNNATINAITNAITNAATNANNATNAVTNVANNTFVIPSLNATTQAIPIEAIGNFTQNFLYVYIIIIGFYFGSRLCEHVKVFQVLKDVDPLDIAKKRYAMGDIDSTTFKGIKNDFGAEPVLKISDVNKDLIKIKHKGGEEIDLKKATMIIKAKDKKITIEPVAQADKKDVFKADEVMEINMTKVISQEKKDAITIGGESTGVTNNDIHAPDQWEESGGVEVLLFYTGERKITMIGEVKAKQSTEEASNTSAEGTAEQSRNNESE
jgi:hypothetical protein